MAINKPFMDENKPSIDEKPQNLFLSFIIKILKETSSLFSLFFIIIVVFSFKSSILDANNIPTGSMIPTLKIGDFLFVNKMRYGLRVPFSEEEIYRIDEPKRGDIVTFNAPDGDNSDFFLNEHDIKNLRGLKKYIYLFLTFFEEELNWKVKNMFKKKYVKRIVAMPGDSFRISQKEYISKIGKKITYTFIEYKEKNADKFLTYNPKMISPGKELLNLDNIKGIGKTLFIETKNGFEHFVIEGIETNIYSYIENSCSRINNICKIPDDSYLVMGDNRDDSYDSRYWGLVKRDDVLGKVLLIYFSIDWKDNTCMIRDVNEVENESFNIEQRRLTEAEIESRCSPSERYGSGFEESIPEWFYRTVRYRIPRMNIRWERLGRILK